MENMPPTEVLANDSDALRVVVSAANIVAGSHVLSTREFTHGVRVRVVEGPLGSEKPIFDHTVREGPLYGWRTDRRIRQAQRLTGATALFGSELSVND